LARIKYQFEFERKVRAAFIGCGSHSFRNVYPTFQYCPIDLVAVCDLNGDRAKAFARMYGAERSYTDYHEMLEKEDLEAIFTVTNYDENGRPRVGIARDALDAGCHVWMEKPPASSAAEIEDLIEVARKRNTFALVAFKKAFFPAVEKAKEIIGSEEFGGATSGYFRYPQYVPSREEMDAGLKRRSPLVGFLDHLVHPFSAMNYLLGGFERLYYRREPNGGACAVVSHEGGIVSTLHFTSGASVQAPLERYEIVGRGANLVVDNGMRLIYYRPDKHLSGGYGRETAFQGPVDSAPVIWEPEFSLGQLYNKGLFLLGYWGEVNYFLECVLNNTPPDRCGLDDALMVMKGYDAFLRAKEGEEVEV